MSVSGDAEYVRAVAEATPSALLSCDTDGVVMWCNPAARCLLGVTEGVRLADRVAEDARDLVVGFLGSMTDDASDREAQVSVRGSDLRPLELVACRAGTHIAVTVYDMSAFYGVIQDARGAATVDPLTELANRAAMVEIAEVARRSASSGKRPCMLLIDLDGFKSINDRLGHVAGDHVLCVVAGRLRDTVRGQGQVGRIGGDEFLVVTTDGGIEAATELAGRVLQELRRPIDELDESVGGSIGISRLVSDADVTQALSQADNAMHRAKAAGRGSALVYEPTGRDLIDVRYYDRAVARWRRLAERDGGTGLLRRDTVFDRDYSDLVRRCHQEGQDLSVLLIDVDLFHEFNERYLYAAGDTALRSVADSISSTVRPLDPAYRFGGEEFIVLLADTTADDAIRRAEDIRRGVEQLGILHAGSPFGVLTVSIGVCTLNPEGEPADPTTLLHGANRALLDAKTGGRNSVAHRPPQPDLPPISTR